jgi:hypothetical protein
MLGHGARAAEGPAQAGAATTVRAAGAAEVAAAAEADGRA